MHFRGHSARSSSYASGRIAVTQVHVIRRQEICWEDPASLGTASREISGLELLQDMLAGRRPAAPIMSLMGMTFAEISHGLVVMSLTPQECQYNMLGTVHGGVMATLLDSVMGCAVHSTLPARGGYSTVEIKVNYVRPITLEVNSLRAEGRVLHAGRRIVTAEGAVRDSTNHLYAHGTSTCLLFDLD
jgi:uncharacterized protein (TIGR00369 family)